MKTRLAGAAVALLLAAASVTGCAPEPKPAEPAPAFTSEAEAFAAAEETYRAYVDALNQRRKDPSSSPDPEDFLTGSALEVDIDTQRQLDQTGLSITGATAIASIDPVSSLDDLSRIEIAVCLDSSGTRVTNASGEDVTPDDRATRTPVTVVLESDGKRLLVSESESSSDGSC